MAQFSQKELMLLGRIIDRVESELRSNESSLCKLDSSTFATDSAYERRLSYLHSQKARLEFVLNGLMSFVEN